MGLLCIFAWHTSVSWEKNELFWRIFTAGGGGSHPIFRAKPNSERKKIHQANKQPVTIPDVANKPIFTVCIWCEVSPFSLTAYHKTNKNWRDYTNIISIILIMCKVKSSLELYRQSFSWKCKFLFQCRNNNWLWTCYCLVQVGISLKLLNIIKKYIKEWYLKGTV